MSDADRALASRRTRTPGRGVEIHAPEDRTPVTDVLPLAGDDESRSVLIAVWRHIDNLELRLLAKISATSGESHRAELDEHEHADYAHHTAVTEALADIHGTSGQNGKLGELRRRVDALSSKAWWVLSAFVGGIGAAAIKLVMVVRAFDAVEARAAHNAEAAAVLNARVLTLETALLARTRHAPADVPERNPPP